MSETLSRREMMTGTLKTAALLGAIAILQQSDICR